MEDTSTAQLLTRDAWVSKQKCGPSYVKLISYYIWTIWEEVTQFWDSPENTSAKTWSSDVLPPLMSCYPCQSSHPSTSHLKNPLLHLPGLSLSSILFHLPLQSTPQWYSIWWISCGHHMDRHTGYMNDMTGHTSFFNTAIRTQIYDIYVYIHSDIHVSRTISIMTQRGGKIQHGGTNLGYKRKRLAWGAAQECLVLHLLPSQFLICIIHPSLVQNTCAPHLAASKPEASVRKRSAWTVQLCRIARPSFDCYLCKRQIRFTQWLLPLPGTLFWP